MVMPSEDQQKLRQELLDGTAALEITLKGETVDCVVCFSPEPADYGENVPLHYVLAAMAAQQVQKWAALPDDEIGSIIGETFGLDAEDA